MVNRFLNLFFDWQKLRIRRNELVLDVGSGDNPCFRADVICEKCLLDNGQRSGRMKIQIYPHQRLVIGDAESLPFKDKSFDFVICRHLLEHLENPEKGIEELMRVGYRGYIETPSSLMEILYGWQFHKWLVQFNENKIIFIKKSKGQTFGILPKKVRKSKDFEKFVHSNLDVFLVRYRWEGRINYKIESSEEGTEKSTEDFDLKSKINFESMSTSRSWFKNFLLKVPRILWSRRRVNLVDILACPICKDKIGLFQQGDNLFCQKCNRLYRTWNSIPILLPE